MLDRRPLVTVVIPCYNGAEHIDTLMRMMRRQSYTHLELLAIDDGSTDESVRIWANYPEVRLLRNEQNRGLAYTRNRGIREARGAYLHFMDIDDRINSRFYEQMVEALWTGGAETACCGMIHQAARGKTQLFGESRVYSDLYDRLRVTWVGRWGYAVRYLFRTSFLRENGLSFEEGRLIEDLPFSFAAVCLTSSLVTVPGAEYLYVRTPGSIMKHSGREAHERRQRDRRHARDRVLTIARELGVERIPGVTCDRRAYRLRKLRQWLSLRQDCLTEEK